MSEKPITAYPATELEPQDATPGKGLDSKMKPPANWTQLEFWDDQGKNPYLVEYEGRGLLKDKTALITGGDSGIGRSVAILFAREGADITFTYLPEEKDDALATKQEIEKAGRKALLLELDFLDIDNCKKAVDEHVKVFGKLNVLVHNNTSWGLNISNTGAMQEISNDLAEINLESVKKTFTLNNIAMFALVKAALPHMRRGSNIILTGSVAGYMGNPQLCDYASTKGAITTFTRSAAQQLAPKGIRVNAVAPGIIWTPLQPATKGNPPEAMDSLGVGEAPLGRPGMPIEVAGAYVFLASPLGSYTTGETVHVTGGLEVQG